MSGTEITPLEPEQWATWRALRLRALQTSPEAFGSTLAGTMRRDTEQYWRDLLASPGRCFVARISGAVIGMARIVPAAEPGESASIFSVWVDPQARGMGVGRDLIEACIGWAELNLPGVRLRLDVHEDNAPARHLYGRCGFGIVGRATDEDGGPARLILERRAGLADDSVLLPTGLVARYRAVDREEVGSAIVDTPAHLDQLEADIRAHGIRTPLDLWVNEEFGALDGNHRIAVALRLGLPQVPVHVTWRGTAPRPAHARPMQAADLEAIRAASA
ncbi:GNAT family N-acetyltransferase [Brachybacterium hainanense]|uniref:GNAT family N-acetyltransferase n=1 Tax=Brachybacterium hainanense TaxID=1541174 RepID=A0ABV6REA1_9MICO